MAIVWLAHVKERQGKLEEAESLFHEALAGQRKSLGDLHAHTLTTMWGLGRTLVELHRFEQAEEIIRECFEGRQITLEEDDWHTHHTLSLLGASIAGQGRFAEAESMLIESYENMAPPPESMDKKADARERIIDLYRSWHQSDPSSGHDAKADEWAARSEPASENESMPDCP